MNNIIEITTSTLKSEVLESALPVLLEAYTPTCRRCGLAVPILEELAEELGGQAKVVKFDANEELYLAAVLRIAGVPTFLVFKDGKEVARLVGLRTKDHLREALLGVAA